MTHAFFARLRSWVHRLILVDVSGPAYIHAVRACMLRAEYVAHASPEQIAITIVHEGTHARLWSAGFDYGIKRRAQIEAICVRQEVLFALKFPGGDRLAEQARAKLTEQWWTLENEHVRRLAQLKQLGRPDWYIRLVQKLSAPKQ